MTFVLYANTISPHQLPLARELVGRLGAANYRYIYTEALAQSRKAMGWDEPNEPWILRYGTDEAAEWLRDADVVLMQHNRDWDLMEDRLSRGKTCLYSSERWFKPISLYGFIHKGSAKFEIDGRCRMFSPSYRKMARRFLSLTRRHENFKALCIGVHAKSDFLRLGVPEERLVDWGYFVEKGAGNWELGAGNWARRRDEVLRSAQDNAPLKVMWAGRMLGLKRVGDLIDAVRRNARCELTLIGDGPERRQLEGRARGLSVRFRPFMPSGEIRRLMREQDVFVFPSCAIEGWGAVVGEALEEGMQVFGTFEAGASATMLPESHLFHAGDVGRLADLLSQARTLPRPEIGEWTAASAAKRLLSRLEKL